MKAKTIRMAVGLTAALLSIAAATRTEAYKHLRRSSAYGASPAYWGGERSMRSYRDCGGWCWTRQTQGEASVHQLDPRLRARSDGRLLEEVGRPPPPPELMEILPYSYGPVVTVIPRRFFWLGPARGHRFMRWRR
jgi:hypothetical protein